MDKVNQWKSAVWLLFPVVFFNSPVLMSMCSFIAEQGMAFSVGPQQDSDISIHMKMYQL